MILNHIGFSGTRTGMSENQKMLLERELMQEFQMDGQNINWFHHGDCIGADEQAHEIAKKLGYQIVIHPPVKSIYRAYCKGDILKPTENYLRRNEQIVNTCRLLLAAPLSEDFLKRRGGTWYTIRYAGQKPGMCFRILPR